MARDGSAVEGVVKGVFHGIWFEEGLYGLPFRTTLSHDARRMGHSASARSAFNVGLPLPPIARHALTHSSPSYCQVDAPSSVARQDAMNRSNLSELDAQGSAETDLRYSERKDVLFIGCAGID